MKKLLMILALAVGLSGCGEEQKYDVLCVTLYGPIQYEATASQIAGLDDARAVTYTLSLPNGAKLTVAKDTCTIGQRAPDKAEEKASE